MLIVRNYKVEQNQCHQYRFPFCIIMSLLKKAAFVSFVKMSVIWLPHNVCISLFSV